MGGESRMVKRRSILVGIGFSMMFFATSVAAQSTNANPQIPVDLTKAAGGSLPLQIVVVLTLLSFLPALLISMTCLTRLIVVLHFLRQALGTQETPNNQVLIGLALFLTLFVMSPSLTRLKADAVEPLMAGQI